MKDNELIHNFLFSCKKEKIHTAEQVAPEHVLVYVVSGQVEFQFDTEIYTAQPNDILIIRRNRFLKATKIPTDSKTPCQTINIGITQEHIRNIALQNNINKQEKYTGKSIIVLDNSGIVNQVHNDVSFLHAYFASLLPYLEKPEKMSSTMAQLKTAEAIALLLEADVETLRATSLRSFLFDWNEPYKIDLEKFMNQNFMFNVPLSGFARLSGRSLSTFKRDFTKIFANTPENWLRNRRLDEAKRLITHENKKPSEIYYRVGFENFSHFSTAYKEKFGRNASEKE